MLLLKTARDVDGGLPLDVQAQFLFNIIVDFLIGLIPIVGDVVEIMYKANSRNALILEKHLNAKGEKNLGLTRDHGKLIDDTRSISSAAVSEDSEFDSTSPLKSPARYRSSPEENIKLRNQLKVGQDPNRVETVFKERTYSR